MAPLIAARLTWASALDRWDARLGYLLERLGWHPWLTEFRRFLDDERLTLEEFWVMYTLKRMAVQPILTQPMTAGEARKFFASNDYMLWRNVVHRRHSAWRRVLVTMRRPRGELLEFGCGIAPVSAWLRPRRPAWDYILEDVASPQRAFAAARVPQSGTVPGGYDVITALDVFEHLADPGAAAVELVNRLRSGGYLHWNFVVHSDRDGTDLATEAQRLATIAYLQTVLEPVWAEDDHRVSRTP